MPNDNQKIFEALLPPGQLWTPAPGGGLDDLISGISLNMETIRDFCSELAFLRSLEKTNYLDDLEREFGLVFNSSLTEAQRRARVATVKSDVDNDGSASFLEEKLQAFGFDVQVHINNPPVDPLNFLFQEYRVVCGNSESVCGAEASVSGSVVGELVVNNVNDFEFEIPVDSKYWGLVFFIGGDATRDPITDEITDIDTAVIPLALRDDIRRVIVKYKPLHSWAALLTEPEA